MSQKIVLRLHRGVASLKKNSFASFSKIFSFWIFVLKNLPATKYFYFVTFAKLLVAKESFEEFQQAEFSFIM